MLELRILTGLQRGAAMPIEDTKILKIGNDDNADILILDHGIAAEHLTIGYDEDNDLILTPIDEVRGEDGAFIQEAIIVDALHIFCLKGVWIGIANEDDTWDILNDIIPDKLPDVKLELVENDNYHIEPIKISWKSKIFAIGGLLMLASWATASVFTQSTSVLKDNSAQEKKQTLKVDQTVNPIKKVSISKRAYSREDLAEILNTKLMELDLKKFVDTKYDVDGWTLDANLDDEDRLRLERALEWFNTEYKPRFPITVKIQKLANFLPFKVTQIISGRMASIVTEDGQRFYVGDTVDGYRLVSIAGSKAIFDGKRKIEIIL
jgi:type III secretion protein D